MKNDVDDYLSWAPEYVALEDIDYVISFPVVTHNLDLDNPLTMLGCRIKDPRNDR